MITFTRRKKSAYSEETQIFPENRSFELKKREHISDSLTPATHGSYHTHYTHCRMCRYTRYSIITNNSNSDISCACRTTRLQADKYIQNANKLTICNHGILKYPKIVAKSGGWQLTEATAWWLVCGRENASTTSWQLATTSETVKPLSFI